MKAALVTGAGRRVGRGIALALAAEGWAVALHHNGSREGAAAAAAEIVDRGGRAVPIQADLSDAADADGLVTRAAHALGAVTLLVNSAATFEPDTAATLDPTVWDRQLAVNLRAPALLVARLHAALPEGGSGSAINILDQKVGDPTPDFFSYTVSKCALAAMTRMHARAFAPRLRVNGVAPGLTLPSGKQTEERFRSVHGQTPLGRGNSVADIARAVLYLAGAEAVTGQILCVDGGSNLAQTVFDPSMIGP